MKIAKGPRAKSAGVLGRTHLEREATFGGAIRESSIPAGSKLEYLGPGRVKFDGVEFRAVRDLGHLSEAELRAMKSRGLAAKDFKGEILEGHHHLQQYHREPGAFVVEIPEPLHCTSNTNQHPLGNKGGLGVNTAERQDWNKLRNEYWKERAKTELLKRGIE